MKWRVKNANNQRCIVSDCGDYTISRYTCGGKDIYLTHCRGKQIGNGTDNGNAARSVAEKHKAKGKAA